jgi:quercetin dioxygenase-like cupin family protein
MTKVILTVLLLLCASPSLAETAGKVTPLMQKEFANIPGKDGLMLTVDFAPGEVSPVHRHNAHVFVYVLEGSVVMGVKGGTEATLKAGDTFYENPTDIHTVAKNASTTAPAKILVFMVKDKSAPPVLPVE